MYKELLAKIWAYLRARGWLKKSDTFYFRKNGNWELINFQRSRSNSKESVSFTINLGISSTALRKFQCEDVEQKPDIEDCHWRIRIGFLLSEKQDQWWVVRSETILSDLFSEIIFALEETGIPEMVKYSSDDSLEGLWLSQSSNGLTEFQRYVHLTTLLKLRNSKHLFLITDEFMKFSKGKSFESTSKYHIDLLNKII